MMLGVIYLLIVAGAGYALMRLVDRKLRRDAMERVGLAASLGMTVVPMILFWLAIVGVDVSGRVIWIMGLVAGAVIAWDFLRSSERQKSICWPKLRGAEWVILVIGGALLTWSAAEIASDSLIEGVSIWDAFSIWMLKAKVIAAGGLQPMPAYFHELSLSYSHLDYPLGVPILAAGAFAFTGGEADESLKLPQVLVLIGLVATLMSTLMRFVPVVLAVLLTAIAISSFAVVRFGGSGTADLTMVMMTAALLSRLLAWHHSGHVADAILAGVFAGGAIFTKNEGLAIAVIYVGSFVVAALVARRRSGARTSRGTILIPLVAGATSLAWLIWIAPIPRTHEDYGGRLTIGNVVSNLDRTGEIARSFWSSMSDLGGWGGVWFILPACAVLGIRRFHRRDPAASATIITWSILVLHWLTVVLALIISPWEVREVAGVALDRVLSHSAPCAVTLIAMHLSTMHRSPGA